MIDFIFWVSVVAIPVLSWFCGYYIGKANGIREVRYLLDEQWSDYERFRDLVFEEMGIEVNDE